MIKKTFGACINFLCNSFENQYSCIYLASGSWITLSGDDFPCFLLCAEMTNGAIWDQQIFNSLKAGKVLLDFVIPYNVKPLFIE